MVKYFSHTYDNFRVDEGSPDTVNTGTQRAVSLGVRWGNVDKSDVRLHVALIENLRNLMQEDRDAVSATLVHGLSHVTTNKQADGLEVL